MQEPDNLLSLSMVYTGCERVENWWNFKDVMSPFYRLYYIKSGEGTVYINEKAYNLTANKLFLIPKFAYHRYECDSYMEHYYICFFDDMYSCGIVHPELLDIEQQAMENDFYLIKRFLTLNPNRYLPNNAPKHYDNNSNLYKEVLKNYSSPYQSFIESHGILMQLFSRFITKISIENSKIVKNSRLDYTIRYIDKNIDKPIKLKDLSNLMCVSPDYYSKIFKKIMGISPNKYIQMKRVERAKILLSTTTLPIAQIAEKIGIVSSAQFSHLFSKFACCSPKKYRTKKKIFTLNQNPTEELL